MAAEGIGQEELARKLGKDAGEISRIVALGELAPEVQEKLGRPNFSLSHIREIMRLPNSEEQLKIADGCEKGDWSSKALRAKVDKMPGAGLFFCSLISFLCFLP